MQDILDSDDFVAFHAGLKGTDGIDFSDIDSGSTASECLGASLSDVSETTDQSFFTSDHDIGGSIDAVDKGVLAAVDIVELRLGD